MQAFSPAFPADIIAKPCLTLRLEYDKFFQPAQAALAHLAGRRFVNATYAEKDKPSAHTDARVAHSVEQLMRNQQCPGGFSGIKTK